jgi:hypothetical protein
MTPLVRDVGPAFAREGALQHTQADSVFASHLPLPRRLFLPATTNVAHRIVGEFGPRAFLAIGASTVNESVGHIRRSCGPAKIRDVVVPPVPIVVGSVIGRIWRRTNKGQQHETVRAIHLAAPIPSQSEEDVASCINVPPQGAASPSAARAGAPADSARVADFVIRQAGNNSPFHKDYMGACLSEYNLGGQKQ